MAWVVVEGQFKHALCPLHILSRLLKNPSKGVVYVRTGWLEEEDLFVEADNFVHGRMHHLEESSKVQTSLGVLRIYGQRFLILLPRTLQKILLMKEKSILGP